MSKVNTIGAITKRTVSTLKLQNKKGKPWQKSFFIRCFTNTSLRKQNCFLICLLATPWPLSKEQPHSSGLQRSFVILIVPIILNPNYIGRFKMKFGLSVQPSALWSLNREHSWLSYNDPANITCLKPTIETLEKGVKYVRS